MGYESFLMEIGLYGNPLGHDYTRFFALTMDGAWFKNVWEWLKIFMSLQSLEGSTNYHLSGQAIALLWGSSHIIIKEKIRLC